MFRTCSLAAVAAFAVVAAAVAYQPAELDTTAEIARAGRLARDKAQIVADLAAGRVPLAVAAARFQAVEADWPYRGLEADRCGGATEGERYARLLIGRVERILPPKAKEQALARLADELAAIVVASGESADGPAAAG